MFGHGTTKHGVFNKHFWKPETSVSGKRISPVIAPEETSPFCSKWRTPSGLGAWRPKSDRLLSEQVRREFRQLGPLAFGQLDMRGDRLAPHPIVAVDEAVATGIDIWIVDLRRIADQDDF
jgi:hypothetical protein